MNVEVRNLTKCFGKARALDDVSFTLEAGRVYGFIGPNGAGKTTALRIMAGLDAPTSGDVRYDGVSVREYPEKIRGLIGFMPDTIIESSETTVAEYLDNFARAFGLRGAARVERVKSVADYTQLGDMPEKLLSSLSKGMKQRVSLARILLHDPETLLLDEPAAGLDPRARVELAEILRKLAVSGRTILISSHILSELDELCDGVLILENGKLVRSAMLRDLSAARSGPPAEAMKIVLTFACGAAEGLLKLKDFPFLLKSEIKGPRQVEILVAGDENTALEHVGELFAHHLPIAALHRPETGLEGLFLAATEGKVQ